jgi:predicted ATPase
VRQLPSGTVTLLFTDIAGSTRLLEDLGDRYADALAEHRRVLRAAFERHGGVEVDTQGDAFFVAFEQARNAIAAAVDGQSELAANGPIRVRVGVHTGEPTRTDEGYVGIDVHRAARIAAAGHGGQILLSEPTRQLVARDDLRDLGEHRLRDVGQIRLYQVGDETFPPLKTLNQTNLPPPATALVGRKREVADLVRLLRAERDRMITIVGPGGIGKTRLALEAAGELVTAYEDGVTFVDLSAIRDPQLVEPAILTTLGLGGELVGHLRERELLLVLDNLEQVVSVAPELGRLLDRCPRLALLATSREPLRLKAEREYPLRPLAEAPAVELFRRRAQAIEPEFQVEYGRLTELCDRLERMPLAIELAAARVRMLSMEELLSRLERRLSLLTGGARDAPERQRTLRATIAWSYELLGEHERRLFALLAVFSSGWTLAAAEDVCDAGLDTLQSLVDKNLVRIENGRFRMLETIREYALERLEESGEAEQVQSRHAAHYLALAVRAEPELTGAEQHVWLERLATDYENVRSALGWYATVPTGAPEGLRLAGALPLFWFNRSLYRDGLHWLERMLEATGSDRTRARAGALWGAGLLWALVGDEERAARRLREGLALARELGDDVHVARSLSVLGLLAFFENDIRRARALFEESVDVARTAGDAWGLADALGTLGSIYPLQGEFDRAEAAGSEAAEIGRRFGDRQGIRMANFGLALTAARRGRILEARSLSEEGLAICREIGDLWFVSYFLWILATTAVDSGEYARARVLAEESLHVARELEGPLLVVCALDAMAAVARAEGDDEAAHRHLLEAADVGRSSIVPDSYVASVLRGLGELATARGELTEAAACLEESSSRAHGVDDPWAAARTMSAEATLAEQQDEQETALAVAEESLRVQLRIGDRLGAVETLVRLASITGHDEPEVALRLLGAAGAERERVGAAWSPWARERHERVVAAACDALGRERYEALLREGGDLSLEDAAAPVFET